MDTESYCRELEAYLCRKNEGHLIRISGPAFERVSAWARDGIPLTVACQGVDRYFERYYRRGPRRRPVRIEFCEPDVLDAFDTWRRAVGVARPEEVVVSRRPSLASHVERVLARLTSLRGSGRSAAAASDVLDRVARELDACLADARAARGAAREAVAAKLEALDRELMAAVMAALDEGARASAAADAKEQLAAFRDRMPADAYDRALAAAAERCVREQFGLPTLTIG